MASAASRACIGRSRIVPSTRPARGGAGALRCMTRSATASTPACEAVAALAGWGAARAVWRAGREKPAPETPPERRLAVVNGLIGDQLEREGNPTAPAACAPCRRASGRARAGSLAAAFPHARPRLVVFLHGLMETEFAWRLGAGETERRTRPDSPATSASPPWTSATTAAAASPRTAARSPSCWSGSIAAWPVEVEEIALVGHSMGGLVARSACHQAAEEGAAWVERVRHVISLGSPHLGAPLAQGVHVGPPPSRSARDAPLRQLPRPPQRRHPRPAPRLAGRRGLARPRSGRPARSRVQGGAAASARDPLLRRRHHHSRRPAPARPPARRRAGAWPAVPPGARRTRRIGFRDEDGFALGGAHHLALLNHPAVYERLREWIGRQPMALSAAWAS